MSYHDNALVIPAMDKTSISIHDDGYLYITQKSPDGDENTILVPYPYIPTFIDVLTAVIEDEGKKQRAETATGDVLTRIRRSA